MGGFSQVTRPAEDLERYCKAVKIDRDNASVEITFALGTLTDIYAVNDAGERYHIPEQVRRIKTSVVELVEAGITPTEIAQFDDLLFTLAQKYYNYLVSQGKDPLTV